MAKYLSNDGVSHLLSLLKNKFVSQTRKVNGKALTSDVTLTNADISGFGTSSTKDVAQTGNASSTQVVMGNDTRLSDARSASDVSAWAKATTKPTYTATEVGAVPNARTVNGKALSSNISLVASDVGAATASDIASAIAAMKTSTFEKVTTLPATYDASKANVIFLLSNGGSGTNKYDEYGWVNNAGTMELERLGTTDTDLSGYLKTTDVVALTNTEIATIVTNAFA